jgi:hypothetical protein
MVNIRTWARRPWEGWSVLVSPATAFRMTFRSKLTLQVQRTPAPTPRVSKPRNGGAVAFTPAVGSRRRACKVAERRHLTGEVLRSALGEAEQELSELLDGGVDVG